MATQFVDLPLEGGSGGITSINGNTNPAQTITGGTGISISSSGGTTTITNTEPAVGYVPYTGATGNVNLGVYSITATGGDFSDSTNTYTADLSQSGGPAGYFSDGNNGNQISIANGGEAFYAENVNTAYVAQLVTGGSAASFNDNSDNDVTIANNSVALGVTNEGQGYIANLADSSNGAAGYFSKGSLAATFAGAYTGAAGNFTDGANTVTLTNGTYAIYASGTSYLAGNVQIPGYVIQDSGGSTSIDPNNDILHSGPYGVDTVNYGYFQLMDQSSVTSGNWNLRQWYDTAGNPAAGFSNAHQTFQPLGLALTPQHVTATSAGSVGLSSGISALVLHIASAGTIATYTVTLPASTALVDGQSLVISTDGTITALTVTAGSGTTISPTLTTLTKSTAINLIYNLTQTEWLAAGPAAAVNSTPTGTASTLPWFNASGNLASTSVVASATQLAFSGISNAISFGTTIGAAGNTIGTGSNTSYLGLYSQSRVQVFTNGNNTVQFVSTGENDFYSPDGNTFLILKVANSVTPVINSINSLNIQTNNGTTALSLDTSQNATITGAVKISAPQTTLTGSAGTAICSQPSQGTSHKKAVIYLNGYTDTGTQTYTFPTAFVKTPFLYGLAGGISGATVTTTTIKFTTTLLSGFVFAEGY